jgi:hypothetical protein
MEDCTARAADVRCVLGGGCCCAGAKMDNAQAPEAVFASAGLRAQVSCMRPAVAKCVASGC